MAEKISSFFALNLVLKLALFISLVCVVNISALTEPMVHSMHQRNFEFVDMQKASNETTVSTECNQTLAIIVNSTTQKWMYADAAGKPAGGLFMGNGAWLGSYSECKTIPASHYCLASLLFRVANRTLPQVQWGLCVPKACSERDVLYGLEDIITGLGLNKYVQLSSYGQIDLGVSAISSRAVNCAKSSEYNTGVIVTLTLCGIILLLCFLGSITELILFYMQCNSSAVNKSTDFMPVRNGPNRRDKEVNSTTENGKMDSESYPSTEHAPLIASSASNFVEKKKKNIVVQVLLCFSLIRNTNQIMDTKVPPGAITSLNGMRVLSMWWVILGHTYIWSLIVSGVTSNLAVVLKLQKRFTFQTIQNAELSVDSFFFLSGLLVCYLSLRQMTKLNGNLPLFKFYFHRFWRLTPSYMFLLLFWDKLNGFLGEGPVWFTQQQNVPCDKYWWTNLLYINNFYPTHFQKTCMDWTWYLANDMQFYIISPIILYAAYRFKWRGLLATAGVFLLASFISTASIVGYYKISVDGMGGNPNARNMDMDPKKIDQYQSYIYVKPYCRIAPYLVGMALGCLFHYKPKIFSGTFTKAVTIVIGWALAITFAVASLYGKYGSFKPGGHPFNRAENIIYESFSRFAWAVALAWVIFICHRGYGGLVDKLLSASFWIPLSRLTYSAYLVHPIVLGAYFSSYETAIAYSDTHIAFYFCGILVLSYAAAFIVAVAVEFPMMQLEKVLFKSRERDR